MPGYAELHARSAFSFGDGTATPEALVRRAAELEIPSLALTDTADLGGLARFALECERQGVRPIAGAELRVDRRPVVLLARSEVGYRNLAALITRARLENVRGTPALRLPDLMERNEGLFALTGGASGPLAARVLRGKSLSPTCSSRSTVFMPLRLAHFWSHHTSLVNGYKILDSSR